MTEEKKYQGYGYHGGGRKPTGIKRVSFCVSCTPEERTQIKEIAEKLDVTISELVIGTIIEDCKPVYEVLDKMKEINNEALAKIESMKFK